MIEWTELQKAQARTYSHVPYLSTHRHAQTRTSHTHTHTHTHTHLHPQTYATYDMRTSLLMLRYATGVTQTHGAHIGRDPGIRTAEALIYWLRRHSQ
ncbi:hypothetical protein LY78DRAFT_110681 [Colletotrichum sublineola]|nr:hypothetical protein LY78DRAFT_110681 [Colletotrichum sublineola]